MRRMDPNGDGIIGEKELGAARYREVVGQVARFEHEQVQEGLVRDPRVARPPVDWQYRARDGHCLLSTLKKH
jgi:hypothetical protein